ncbi:ricin-type beta-trefoil lectin protein [Actinophytocola oryzae]|uniref:Ricin-type beta-trefoil lectin protein n=2 Tax=Actinophytocola oryzae TaxID=502181 RepID=A0A4R7VRN5_9PSEU|nr:ricin-type beta-trefoil lectin protein [Actinophytocola oryzae]
MAAVLSPAGTNTALAAGADNSANDVGIAATTFADEFNAPAGTPVDGSKWNMETGDNVNNHERQYYTNSTSNAVHDGQGNLVITARRENPGNYNCWYGRCEYTSARLNTSGKFSQAYGTFETRLKMSRGQGMWPAFWLLGGGNWPNDGEIDVMENVGFEPNTVHGTIHGPGYSGGEGIGAGYSIGSPFADGFHTFRIEWSPNKIVWKVDGNTYQTRTPSDLGGDRWVFDHGFFLILNLAVGGYWPGDPNSSTPMPNTLTVDYVRVTNDQSGGGGGGGRITGIGGKCVDVAGASSANGTAVQLYDCNGTAAQQWSVNSDGTIRALGKCLDVTAAGTADGTKIQLYDCNGSNAQKWRVEAAKDIANVGANKCLDATGGSSANGTRLQIWTCTGAASQKWTVG